MFSANKNVFFSPRPYKEKVPRKAPKKPGFFGCPFRPHCAYSIARSPTQVPGFARPGFSRFRVPFGFSGSKPGLLVFALFGMLKHHLVVHTSGGLVGHVGNPVDLREV